MSTADTPFTSCALVGVTWNKADKTLHVKVRATTISPGFELTLRLMPCRNGLVAALLHTAYPGRKSRRTPAAHEVVASLRLGAKPTGFRFQGRTYQVA